MFLLYKKLSHKFSDKNQQQLVSNLNSHHPKISANGVHFLRNFGSNSLELFKKSCRTFAFKVGKNAVLYPLFLATIAVGFHCENVFAQSKTILPVPKIALPTGGQVVAGNATINSTSTANSAVMNINQTSQRAVVNWDSFNVGKMPPLTLINPMRMQ